MKELKHQNIVLLHDVVHTQTTLTLVFEFMDLDLKKFMDAQPNGRCEPKICCGFTWQLLNGVKFCHENKVLSQHSLKSVLHQ